MKCLGVVGAVLALVGGGFGLDREAFTFTRYDLSLRLEPAQQRLGVRGTVTLRNDSSQPQRVAALQISSSLNWRSIRAVGKSPDDLQALQFLTQPYTSDIDHTGELSEAIVTLPREIAPKESVTLSVGYEGVIVLDTGRLKRIGVPDAVARHSDWDQIGKTFTAVRGIGYVAWYPVAMDEQNLSDDAAMFTALGNWKARHAESQMELQVKLMSWFEDMPAVLINGKGCAAEEDDSSGTIAMQSCSFPSLGWSNPVLIVGDFRESAAGPLRLHYATEHEAVAQEFAAASQRVTYLIKDWFGPPQEKLDVIDLADADAAPFEAAGWLLMPLAKSRPQIEETLAAHQLAHAAFPSPRLWIEEGAAYFAQALAHERDGRAAVLDYLATHRLPVVQAEKQSGGAGESLTEASQEVLYRDKAALVWWMLKDMVGEVALKRALHAYRSADDKDPAYLQRLIEAESKRDLGWFFHDWVYTDAGLPDFRIESANARVTNGTNCVTAVSVANAGAAGAEIIVTVRTATTDFTQRLEVRAKAKGITRIATPAEPLEVIVNDGSVPELGESVHRFKIARDEAK